MSSLKWLDLGEEIADFLAMAEMGPDLVSTEEHPDRIVMTIIWKKTADDS